MIDQTKIFLRTGLSEFVPEETAVSRFLTAYHPGLANCQNVLKDKNFDTLLDPGRLLALLELVRAAAERSGGDVIELGVYKGGSAAVIAWALREARLDRTIYLCDTFEGMPQTLNWEFHKEYDFADTSYEAVSGRLLAFLPDFPFRFHVGLFSQTLPSMTDCGQLCFAHVDADLYESVRDACEFVYPRMAKGGIILFDDYGAPTCPGAKKAVDDFFADKMEVPTHVSGPSYGVRIGKSKTDFLRLLVKRTLLPALRRATYRAPFRAGGRSIRAISEGLASPKVSKMLAGPLLYGVGRSTPGLGVRDARKILVLRADAIGDMVLMTPFLRELRRSNPSAWITMVTDPRFVNLVELCPYVNEVLTFDPRFGGRMGRLQLHSRALRLALTHLWPRKFDLAFLPRWDVDYYHSTYVAYFSRAPRRVGYSEKVSPLKHDSNRNYDCLLTRTLDDRAPKHEVERNLDFLREVGGIDSEDGLELWLSEEDRDLARKALTLRGIRHGDLVIGIAPGAGHPKRIWPIGRFIEFGRFLQREHGARLLIVGGTEDRDRTFRLQEELGSAAVAFSGEMTLRQTAALLEQTQLMVANDSGPMHLAAAAGAAILEISCHPVAGDPSHANSPVRFHPWTKQYAVLQPTEPIEPCTSACEWHDAHCILGVSLDAAKTAARTLLAHLDASKSAKIGTDTQPR